MSSKSLTPYATTLLQTIYEGNPLPATVGDMQTYIGRPPVQIEDMAERHEGERLSVVKRFDERLYHVLVGREFGKLQIIYNDLSDERLKMTIDLITEHYTDLFVSDLVLFTKMMAKGAYGQPYGKPTPPFIFECFAKYYEDRETCRGEHRIKKHRERVQEGHEALKTIEVVESYKRMKKGAQNALKSVEPKKQVLNIENLGL